ncbi:hypothetical protein SMI01S_12120 [Sphingobacterium mizutaii NBRC 14946 = DSM 11724]|uniref:HTH cro/C1-type domain-containing protein n=2 Tax=Sphingobacterium mizutaii TaxID=1010 RepID=A0AAJ5C130_9SPHI|nr:helix-turn-helix transcriptional regulator [Sphingobacterium mizutaii]GEM67606.1 hypothetical protein SMI01S_12120 [Sphingobacterium mizutaii NBRC 14946 = DSM 11724]SDL15159.1 Transcriptional regulator, contains XRE-family HTH domain [Sphingobacterium mizutaii]SNV52326.1 Uncharacterised protein [Sphingobacterium mizutaii]
MENNEFEFTPWQEIAERLIDNYLTLIDLNIRYFKDFEYSFIGYTNEKLAAMLEHRAKFDFNIDETIDEIKRLARTHRSSIIYDHISLYIYFAKTTAETTGGLYLIEPYMGEKEIGDLFETRKEKEEELLDHINDFKEFVWTHWDPNNGIRYRMRTNEIFKKVREESGLSQVQIAELVEATQGTISNIEKSFMANPTYDILKGYITKVGANPIFLFGIDTSAPPIIHPSIQKERLAGKKEDKVKNELIKELEGTIKKLKSL